MSHCQFSQWAQLATPVEVTSPLEKRASTQRPLQRARAAGIGARRRPQSLRLGAAAGPLADGPGHCAQRRDSVLRSGTWHPCGCEGARAGCAPGHRIPRMGRKRGYPVRPRNGWTWTDAGAHALMGPCSKQRPGTLDAKGTAGIRWVGLPGSGRTSWRRTQLCCRRSPRARHANPLCSLDTRKCAQPHTANRLAMDRQPEREPEYRRNKAEHRHGHQRRIRSVSAGGDEMVAFATWIKFNSGTRIRETVHFGSNGVGCLGFGFDPERATGCCGWACV